MASSISIKACDGAWAAWGGYDTPQIVGPALLLKTAHLIGVGYAMRLA